MYINLEYLTKENLSFMDVFILQLAKQQKYEDCSSHLEKCEKEILVLITLGYLKTIKGNKKDSGISKLRITEKGADFLDNLETPEIIDEDITLFNWMKGIYLAKDKKLGNQKKTKLYIALFRVHSGISRNRLAHLLSVFIEDDTNMQYNMVLEYAFYKPQNAYATRFSLEESRLYQYYLTHQEYFDQKFETLNG